MNKKSAVFVVDTTLGRLAKWLRIIGFDAHYQPSYKNMEIENLLKDGRILLTRNKALKDNLRPSILISSDKIQNQLMEIKKIGLLPLTNKNWSRRCIRCNNFSGMLSSCLRSSYFSPQALNIQLMAVKEGFEESCEVFLRNMGP